MGNATPHSVSSKETTFADSRASCAVVFRIADQLAEVESALRLVYEAYRERGLIRPQVCGVRITPFHLLPTSEILIAKTADRVICTTTLIYDNAKLGLPLEAIYPEEVALRRQRGLRLAEVSCLADDPHTKTPLAVVVKVMALTAQCARRRGIDQLLITVHPHHADFYRGFFGLEPFGDIKPHPSVQGHLAVAMALDIPTLAARNPRAYRRAFEPPFPEESLRSRPLSRKIRDYLRFLLEDVGALEARPTHHAHQPQPVLCVEFA